MHCIVPPGQRIECISYSWDLVSLTYRMERNVLAHINKDIIFKWGANTMGPHVCMNSTRILESILDLIL